ncbi:MAG: hypothetical protein INR70_11605 [Parafilimonas terrae]|nr:hypothetical protein [Parafilimonas terrae]
MNDRSQQDGAVGRVRINDDVLQRLGSHAIGLLQAARDSGDPALIAQAEAMAMAVGFTLASGMPSVARGVD